MKQAEQLFGFMKESNDFPKDWEMSYLRRRVAFSVLDHPVATGN